GRSYGFLFALHAQARIDREVQQIDDQVDDDENEGDQDQVGRHHGDVHHADRLDEEQPHAGPLEDRFRDDGKGDDGAQLQARDGDDGHHGVLQSVAEIDQALGQAAGARELDELGE